MTASDKKPNIIFILADDLGTYELGCYGQTKIRTPHIDQLAKAGMKFNTAYAGNNVCAPSRCVLMTGLHAGHAFVRDNREVKPEGQISIPANSVTIAKTLKQKGYQTAAIGKWGLGSPGSEGDPNKQGFDLFFGYNCQRHAHNHYPKYLWKNAEKLLYPENKGGAEGDTFSHDLFEKEALQFIRQAKDKPFFLYLPFIIPHLALQVPESDLAEYKGLWDDPPYTGGKGYLPHQHPRAAYAAMITRMDKSVGRIVTLLNELKLAENTLIIFTSDNGPTYDRLGGSDSQFFNSSGKLRGYKGSMYEGGIRVPFIASWPGKIRPGAVTDHPVVFYDVMPTLCEVAGAEVPTDRDGLSFLPTLLGSGEQKMHSFLYWESPGYGGQQAIRMGNWKAVRQQLARNKDEVQLYDLKKDEGESRNVAKDHPEIVKQGLEWMKREHVPSKEFPIPKLDQP